MLTKNYALVISMALAGLFLSACRPQDAPAAAPTLAATSAPAPLPIRSDAEASLVPWAVADLAFLTSGQVAEILVAEGDQVEVGDIVARLGNREELEARLANAEVELLAAHQALQLLYDNLPEEQTAALQALNNARAELRDAERKLNGFGLPSEPLDIEVARANVALAKKALDEAEKNFRPYANKPESSLQRATLLNRLADAQEQYDNAVERLNRLTGVIVPDFDREQAETELRIAQSRLALTEQKNARLQDGPDPQDVAAAEARIAAADAALAAARAALTYLDLTATISGTVVAQDLTIGQQVTAGQPVITLADFSQMAAETSDLNEIEVVNVSVGQAVTLIPDALPDLELTGKVTSISQQFEQKQGDITYTARIRLDEIDPRLRWGMTVAVIFEQ